MSQPVLWPRTAARTPLDGGGGGGITDTGVPKLEWSSVIEAVSVRPISGRSPLITICVLELLGILVGILGHDADVVGLVPVLVGTATGTGARIDVALIRRTSSEPRREAPSPPFSHVSWPARMRVASVRR